MTLEFYAAATAAILYHMMMILPALCSNSLSMMFHVELRDGKKKQKNKKKKKKKKYSSYSMLFKLSLHKTHVCDLLLGLDRGQKEL
jgi:hypothetical protein